MLKYLVCLPMRGETLKKETTKAVLKKLSRACPILWWCQFRYFIRRFKWILVTPNLQDWTKILFVMIRDNIINVECCISLLRSYFRKKYTVIRVQQLACCTCRNVFDGHCFLIPSDGKTLAIFTFLFRFFYACPSFRWEGEWVILDVIHPLVGGVGKLFCTWQAARALVGDFSLPKVICNSQFLAVRTEGRCQRVCEICWSQVLISMKSIWLYLSVHCLWFVLA